MLILTACLTSCLPPRMLPQIVISCSGRASNLDLVHADLSRAIRHQPDLYIGGEESEHLRCTDHHAGTLTQRCSALTTRNLDNKRNHDDSGNPVIHFVCAEHREGKLLKYAIVDCNTNRALRLLKTPFWYTVAKYDCRFPQ